MASFTVRVVLHGAEHSEDGYKELHAAMKKSGFSRYITSDDGTKYHMPLAEYNFEGNKSADEVRFLARDAADGTGYKNAVLVTESERRAWIGLTSV